MSLQEKIGQMTQADISAVRPGMIKAFGLGSVLSGGGINPTPNNPQTWAARVRVLQREALDSRLGVPLLYGVDAVHGHNNVRGATIFPHNVGLGATRDPDLVSRVGEITALELLATNVRWTFAPAMSVPRDIRWGRTFEGFGQDPELVASLGAALIRGLTGGGHRPVLASAKHFVGDGGTGWGTTPRYDWIERLWRSDQPDRWRIDQGDLQAEESELRAVHLSPYRRAIAAGVLSVMVSYSSWNGQKLHAHRFLLTDILKGELGFEGFVVSDWLGVDQLDADYETAVAQAVNAGIDMVMVPFQIERFIRAVEAGVRAGIIAQSRIDDACRRILRVKAALGLFEDPLGDESLLTDVGSTAHRAIARQAVRQSQVLLKNRDDALPLSADVEGVLVAGHAADDVGLQCGGWTIEWQGARGPITDGTTLLQALVGAVSPRTSVRYRPDGRFDADGQIGVVVLSEQPYAEGEGDTDDLSLTAEQVDLVRRVRSQCEVLVLVLYSGRPLIIGEVFDTCDAVVASWLPGTEADGIADVLFGLEAFTGRLPHAWPRSMDQVRTRSPEPPLFPYLFGLRTGHQDLDRLHEDLVTLADQAEDMAAGA